MSQADRGMTPEKILALINEGRARREAPPIQGSENEPPPPVVEQVVEREEPPAEEPITLDATSGLPRRRRVGLRSDPAWMQKTLYLKRDTITEAVKVAEAMGVEFSELVDWALGLQVQSETRSPDLAAILNNMKR